MYILRMQISLLILTTFFRGYEEKKLSNLIDGRLPDDCLPV